ncbi:hypothetical protein D3C83_265870 [compost metagenome]
MGNVGQILVRLGADEDPAGGKIFDGIFGQLAAHVVAPHLLDQKRNPRRAGFQETEPQIRNLLERR